MMAQVSSSLHLSSVPPFSAIFHQCSLSAPVWLIFLLTHSLSHFNQYSRWQVAQSKHDSLKTVHVCHKILNKCYWLALAKDSAITAPPTRTHDLRLILLSITYSHSHEAAVKQTQQPSNSVLNTEIWQTVRLFMKKKKEEAVSILWMILAKFIEEVLPMRSVSHPLKH